MCLCCRVNHSAEPVDASVSMDLHVGVYSRLLCSFAVTSRQLICAGFVISKSHCILLVIMQEEIHLWQEQGWALSSPLLTYIVAFIVYNQSYNAF